MATGLSIEAIVAAFRAAREDEIVEAFRSAFTSLPTEDEIRSALGGQAAEARSLAWLESFMTPKQRAEWDAEDCFTCYGNVTGWRYRIYPLRQFNIEQRTREGYVVAKFCAITDGVIVPLGDMLLAQKLAIESNEWYFRENANIIRGVDLVSWGLGSHANWLEVERDYVSHRVLAERDAYGRV